jgi:Ni,Fe-hydrogenase I cytochrome b subunit
MDIWLNVLTMLVLVGSAFYLSLLPYMTRHDD